MESRRLSRAEAQRRSSERLSQRGSKASLESTSSHEDPGWETWIDEDGNIVKRRKGEPADADVIEFKDANGVVRQWRRCADEGDDEWEVWEDEDGVKHRVKRKRKRKSKTKLAPSEESRKRSPSPVIVFEKEDGELLQQKLSDQQPSTEWMVLEDTSSQKVKVKPSPSFTGEHEVGEWASYVDEEGNKIKLRLHTPPVQATQSVGGSVGSPRS